MKILRKIDLPLLICVLLMCGFGLIMIFSASSASTVLRYDVSSTHYFTRQALILGASIVIGIFAFCMPKPLYKAIGFLGIIGIISFLAIVLVDGEIHGGSRSWIKMAGSTVQPAEFAKTLLIIFMAEYYGLIEKYNSKFSKNQNKIQFAYFIPLIIGGILFALVAKQPDMGSGIIIIGICGLTYLSIPFVFKHFKKLVSPLILLAISLVIIFLCFFGFSEEQKSRFNFKDPCTRYQEDTGYQVCNALIAISNGGLTGVGLGKSTQKYLYLPESHTDMIFPIICEELGAIGGLLVIILYGFILTRIHKIAVEAGGARDKIISYGTLWFFALHILINLLGVLSLIPLTGVPLPFLSYGGSFLINAIVLIFLVERVNVDTKNKKFKKELKELSEK